MPSTYLRSRPGARESCELHVISRQSSENWEPGGRIFQAGGSCSMLFIHVYLGSKMFC